MNVEGKGFKDQVSLFRHIKFLRIQTHRTPAEKLEACELNDPSLSQLWTDVMVKKSLLVNPKWYQMILEKL